MKVELIAPESVTEPRHWVRHDQAFAMMLGRGSIEWGSRRSAMEKFDYAAGDLALCDRHVGEWVGVMATPHLQLGISDAALTAASASSRTPAWARWLRRLMRRWLLGFRVGDCFWIQLNRRWP
jgi:hypothetical protein